MWKSGFDASFVGQALLFLLHKLPLHNSEHSCGAFYSLRCFHIDFSFYLSFGLGKWAGQVLPLLCLQ